MDLSSASTRRFATRSSRRSRSKDYIRRSRRCRPRITPAAPYRKSLSHWSASSEVGPNTQIELDSCNLVCMNWLSNFPKGAHCFEEGSFRGARVRREPSSKKSPETATANSRVGAPGICCCPAIS